MTRKRTSDNELATNTGAASAPSRRKPAARTRAKHTVAPVEAALTPAAEAVSQEVAIVSVYEPAYEEVAQLAYLYWETTPDATCPWPPPEVAAPPAPVRFRQPRTRPLP